MSPEYLKQLAHNAQRYARGQLARSSEDAGDWREVLDLAKQLRALVDSMDEKDIRGEARALRLRTDELGQAGSMVVEIGVALEVLASRTSPP